MANIDKDIVITPNTGQAADPTISFVGFDNTPCTLTVNSNGTLTVNRQFISSVATGTAPFAVSSATRVANLNVATAGTADILTTARAINGTNFNGSAAITTVNWGTARNINGTSVNGSANYAIGRIYDTNYRRFTNPGGGEFVTTTATVTGAVRLVFPNVFSNGMYRLTIQIYEYTTGESFTVYAGGHTSGTNWFNVFAYILGNPTTDRRFTVRFGRTAANKAAVYIGEINSAWAYPQVFLTEFQCGFSGFQDNSTGWTTDFTTAALENVTQTVTNCQIGYAVSTNTANSTVLRNASGNFSAGTVTAALSGNATTATTLQTARTINGVSFNGSANITVTANTTNTLTRGTYLTGANFNGAAATTWAVDATTTATANKVVARDASGDDYRRYGYAQFFNMSHGVGTRNTDTVFYSSTDDFIRKNNATGFRTALSAQKKVVIQDAAPAGVASDLWWDSDAGTLNIYYGSAWVEVNPSLGTGSNPQFNSMGVGAAASGVAGKILSAGMTAWNTTTPGVATGNIHIGSASATADAGGAITFAARDGGATVAQAGIYITSGGTFGTKMYLATTNSYVTGSITAMSIDNNGLVAITRSGLTVAGDVTAFSSDIRLKTNIKPIDNSLEKVHSLLGATFDWIENISDLGFTPTYKTNDSGLLAQQVQIAFPQAVAYAPFDRDDENNSKSGEDYLTVKYEKLVPLLVEAIKELDIKYQNIINELREEITLLKGEK